MAQDPARPETGNASPCACCSGERTEESIRNDTWRLLNKWCRPAEFGEHARTRHAFPIAETAWDKHQTLGCVDNGAPSVSWFREFRNLARARAAKLQSQSQMFCLLASYPSLALLAVFQKTSGLVKRCGSLKRLRY